MTYLMNCILVISRYNEKLEWLNEEPFSSYKAIVYNKGENDDFEKKNVIKIVNLENVGREAHSYIYHILSEYNKHYDLTIFLPGSLDTRHKKIKALQLFKIIKNFTSKSNPNNPTKSNNPIKSNPNNPTKSNNPSKSNPSIFIVDQYLFDVKKLLYNLTVSKYVITNDEILKLYHLKLDLLVNG